MKYALAFGSNVNKNKMEIIVYDYYKGEKSMIKFKSDDLLNATEDIIAHQVNCYGQVGGLATAMFRTHRKAYHEYMEWIDKDFEGISDSLGHAQVVRSGNKLIANLYGQYYPGCDYRPDALRKALKELGDFARKYDLSIALPYKLSCGIAGGDWNEVMSIIDDTLEDLEVTIYKRVEDE